MDGYYPHGQLQHEMSHPYAQQRQQQDEQKQQQHNPQKLNTRVPGMPNQRMGPDSLDKVVNDNQSALLRRRSMPEGFASNIQNGERHMSKSVEGDMTTFGDVNNGTGDYEFTQSPSAAYPSVQTNINMQDQLESFMDHPQVSSNLMGGTISNQFGDMILEVRNDINAHMFSPAGQYPPMASDYFSMDMANSALISATPSNAPTTGMGCDDQVKEELMRPRHNTMDSTRSAHTPGIIVDPNMGGYGPAVPTLQHQPWSQSRSPLAKTHLRPA